VKTVLKLPYVIDNQTHRLTDVLNDLLSRHKGQSLDVATVEGLRQKLGGEPVNSQSTGGGTDWQLNREDLRLICFDLITGG